MKRLPALFGLILLLTGLVTGLVLLQERQELRKKAEVLPTETINPKVLLVIYNPIIESRNGRKLTDVAGWNDPDTLTQSFINITRQISNGIINFSIAERNELDEFPLHEDGFQYTDDTFLTCLQTRTRTDCHKPGQEDGFGYLAD